MYNDVTPADIYGKGNGFRIPQYCAEHRLRIVHFRIPEPGESYIPVFFSKHPLAKPNHANVTPVFTHRFVVVPLLPGEEA